MPSDLSADLVGDCGRWEIDESADPQQHDGRKAEAPNAVAARPIIHIGVHKTATNWFQSHLYPAAESHRFVDRRLVRRVIIGTPAFEFDAPSARCQLGLAPGETSFAICEEDLSGVLHDGGLTAGFAVKEIAYRLKAITPDAQIVIMVRNQLSLAASCYHQYLREGGTAGPLRYLFPETHRHLGNVRPLKIPRSDFSQFDHDRLVTHYDNVFGRENVHVFAYEHFAREPASFLASFASRLGLQLPEELDRGRRLNGSYRKRLVPLARMANRFTERSVSDKRVLVHIPYWYTVRKALLEQLNRSPLFGQVPSPAELFGEQAARWMAGRFADGNRQLGKRMGVDLGALGYPVNKPVEPADMPRPSQLVAWMKN